MHWTPSFFFKVKQSLPLEVQLFFTLYCQKYFFSEYTNFTMHSIISIVEIVLIGKKNYLEWS